MENGEPNVERWVEERMAQLEPAGEWRPNVERARAGVRTKLRTARVQRRRWGWTVAAGGALAASLFVIPGCQAATCKVKSENLAERLWKSVFAGGAETRPKRVAPQQQTPEPQAAASVPEAPARPQRRAPEPAVSPENFKESGSPTAAIACEVYTDYECPACARFYSDVAPQLVAEYVATGKVKLLHRDYPLPVHAHARLAARYANAAGLAGHYETAVRQIFQTQAAWGLTGDIDRQLAQVLAPDVMRKVRDLAQSDAHLDDSVAADVEMAQQDQIRQTPSVVIVSRGQRRVIPSGDYGFLKSALDEAVGRQ